jgi:monofunctional biosynthetic peptidoglycan transglycosylase
MPAGVRPRRLRAVLMVTSVLLALWILELVVEIQSYDVAALARTHPRRTALMLQREREAVAHGRHARVDQRWIAYGGISPVLRRAVLIAEDDAFYAHGGLDFDEIMVSARRNLEKRRVVRGGSTVTQQLAKNLFLGDRRTLDRKLREALLAFRLERTLSKRRIFELYLNLIEWGDGIYGAEAAAQRHFGVSASNLGERQAVLLAAVIINPRRYSPVHPDRRIEHRARMIASRLKRRGVLGEAEWARAVGAPAAPVSFPADTTADSFSLPALPSPAATPESLPPDPSLSP